MSEKTPGLLFRYHVLKWSVAACFLLAVFLPATLLAQKEEDVTDDEIPVLVEVNGIGSLEMPTIIRDNDVYLPLNIVFDFLKIKNTFSASFDTLSGFYVNQQDHFLVDNIHKRITFKDTVTQLKPGTLLKADNNLYLNLKYFKPIFKLDAAFNFRQLLITLNSEVELPATREARQEEMRKNINRLNGNIKADTVIKRSYPAFHFGMADWSLMSTQQSIGNNETRLNLGLGAMLAGGEANASLNYSSISQLDEKQQYYQWRYVDNDNDLLRQVLVGKIFTQSIATLNAPLVGVQLTNAPTIARKAYGTYTISNSTNAGWVVELYINGVLVDYKKADASGFYSFEVPLIYGYSVIKLRFFGPYGEERTSQTYINIPFNFLPVHEWEYAASSGIVEDGQNSLFARFGLNYGLSKRITVGGGTEYLSSITSGKTIPFLDGSLKLAQNFLLSGEYDQGVRTKGVLSYRLPSNLQIDLDITNYDKGQTAIYYNYLSERKVTVSMPLHTNFMTLFSRFAVDQITLPYDKYTNLEWTFTGTVKRVSVNFSNYASFIASGAPYMYCLASTTFMLPKKINFTPQLQYDYKLEKPQFIKFTFEKHLLGKGFLNVSYQQFFTTNAEFYTGNYKNILIGMRYDFSFVRLAFSTLSDNQGGYSRVETASGSLIADQKTNYLNFNNRTNVGKGGITIVPYLDINCNGHRDPGEPRAPGLKLHINGGRIIYDDKDTVIRILDLDPYVKYYVNLNTNNFDNIAWQIKNHMLQVTITPDDLTLLEIPIAVVGEVSGTVELADKYGGKQRGERQMIVNVYNSEGGIAARTLTESDGFFSYTGLPPGNFTVQLDTVQLQKLHLKPKRAVIPIHLAANTEGDIADGVEFVLQSTVADTTTLQVAADGRSGVAGNADTNAAPLPGTGHVATVMPAAGEANAHHKNATSIGDEDDTAGQHGEIIAQVGTYTIQVCAVRTEADARKVQVALAKRLKMRVGIVHRGKFYKPRIIGFPKKRDVGKYFPLLEQKGVKGSIIVKLLYPIYKNP